METKLRAAGIIARVGGAMIGELGRQLQKANPAQKRVLVDILARIHSKEAFALILEVLFDPDVDLVNEACQAVRRHSRDATPKARRQLHQQLVRFLNTSRVRNNDRVLTAALLLIGYVGAPQAARLLLRFTTPRNPVVVRRHALSGLNTLSLSGPSAAAVVRQMMKYLNENDPQLVAPALDIIEKQPPLASRNTDWKKFLKSQHAAVRAFAARRLAAQDTPATHRLMMSLLTHPDPQVGEVAASALARHKKAMPLLLAALAGETEPEAAWRLARILKAHSQNVDKASRKKFAALAARALAAGQPRHEALLYFLRNVDPALVDEVLLRVGLQLKRAKKWARAVECLKPLMRAETIRPEHRFELSVCNLKQSPRDLAAHRRADDHALRGFQVLLADKRFRLLERLQREKCLDAADLFYVGFHFSEGVGEEQRFGRQLLEYVARRWPASREGKAAKNKLKLAAAPPPISPTPVAIPSAAQQ
jgi:HEAT repeat protein